MPARKLIGIFSFPVFCLFAFIACNTTGPSAVLPGDSTQGRVSAERLNAARLMQPGSMLLFDVMQQDLTDCTERRCDPLGFDPIPPADPLCPLPNTRWQSRINGPVLITPDSFHVSEYDWLYTTPSGDTEYCLGIRATNSDAIFSQLEFNVRAVNPHAFGHALGTHYSLGQAVYPSNDAVLGNRSLVDFNPVSGGDVAIFVQGINFAGAPASTAAFMNTLGPTAWLVFMRDNAFQSGRFFALVGALKGAPRAFADTVSPADDGAFQSAQVNGDYFDFYSEPQGQLDPANFFVCHGNPTPNKPYAFLDNPNIDEFGRPAPGESGFLFVMRKEAFLTGGSPVNVVVNPNGPVSNITNVDTIPAPATGYNELAIPAISGPNEHNFSPATGPQGVHELAISVFFVHSGS